ncbi:Alpha/beta hydrolase family-domain-containing protein [Coniochaeta sp. 2T2.1]|nr:Alpha/beta hydrolase family-domain-containing protein [Coniochaeta sp. 2T2.1]
MMVTQLLFSTLFWAVLATAGLNKPGCSSVTFSISAATPNPLYSGAPDPNNETDIVKFVHNIFTGIVLQATGTQAVSGTFNINSIYCRPLISSPDDVLEILVHGISYNKTMWSGLGFGDYYNWHTFANLNGYHTLAIDRLGHGTSDHPDPFALVEGALQVEIMHQLIAMIKASSNNPLGRSFDKIAYVSVAPCFRMSCVQFLSVTYLLTPLKVGHSYGSFIGGAHARIYPSDIDALVLTGFSTAIDFDPVANLQLASAATLCPERFPNTPLGYVTTAVESERESAFYAGLYDHHIPQVDFAYKDTVTDGEVAGLGFILQPAFGYTNPVLLVTGVKDALFCHPPISSCRATLDASRVFFPDSTNFQYEAIPETGHCLTLHYSAPATLARVHQFFNKLFRH